MAVNKTPALRTSLNRSIRRRTVCAAFASLFLGGLITSQVVQGQVVQGQVALAGNEPTPEEFASCLAIESAEQRLACFDALARGLSHATEPSEPVVPETTSPTQTDELTISPVEPPAAPEVSDADATDDFGSESIPYRSRENAFEEQDNLQVTITGTRRNAAGKWIMTTSEGQVWQQMDNVRIAFKGTSSQAIISRGLMGSYKIKVAGNARPSRVKRIR